MEVSTGKIAEVMLENAVEQFETQEQMLSLVSFEEPDPSRMQDSSNVIWKPVQQQSSIFSGWDVSGEERGIIKQTYPAVLGTPNNSLVEVRVDDLRNMTYFERQGQADGRRQASELNKDIASALAVQGSLFYRSNATSGYDFISEAQAIMNERQSMNNGRYFCINDRDLLTFGSDLAARQTLQGRPEETWKMGQIGKNIADFDIYTGSFLPNITGDADPAVTVTGAQAFVPSGGSVNATTLVVTNVDYREASLVVNDSSLMTVGDKFTIENAGVAVQSVGRDDKTETGQAMTFSVIELTDATHIKIYPKPIAADQAGITPTEAASANINTAILDGATVTRLNIDATKKTNLFWDKTAIEVLGGPIPANLFGDLEGKKVLSAPMKNGLTMYTVYSGNIDTMTFKYRTFVWYGITVADPAACGVAVTFT